MGYADFGKRSEHMIVSITEGLKGGNPAEEILMRLSEPSALFNHTKPDIRDWLRVLAWLVKSKQETGTLTQWLREELNRQEQRCKLIDKLITDIDPLAEVEPTHMY